MSHVDDECADFSYEWIRRLWRISVWKMEDDYEVNGLEDNIPEDMKYVWHDKFWYFDTAKWTNKIDHRSLPGTCYNSEVHCIFEFNSYEIVDDMMDYIMKTCPKLTKKKRSVLESQTPTLLATRRASLLRQTPDLKPKLTKKKRSVLDDLKPDLMVDTSKVKPKPNLKIPALEISIHTTNERIDKLEKLINERIDELELFDSANFSKHDDVIDELTQKIHDIEEVLNNHKKALENFKNV